MIYYHIYKAGGTTIQKILSQLVTKHMVDFGGKFDGDHINRHVIWWKYLINAYNNNTKYLLNKIKPKLLNDSNIYKFTFIRDPIERFLSGFYEINRSNFAKTDLKNMSGIELLRKLIVSIKTRLKSDEDIDAYLNWHLWPNYKFLSDENWRPIQFDYIGYSKNINHDLPIILKPYLLNQTFQDEHIMKNLYRDINDKIKNVNNKYLIKPSMLTDSDIGDICSLYWMDYLCFPFDVPAQCVDVLNSFD